MCTVYVCTVLHQNETVQMFVLISYFQQKKRLEVSGPGTTRDLQLLLLALFTSATVPHKPHEERRKAENRK